MDGARDATADEPRGMRLLSRRRCVRSAALRELASASQPLGCRVQHVVRLAERETDEVASELGSRVEGGAGNAGDADGRDEPARERAVVVEAERRDVAEDVVGAL